MANWCRDFWTDAWSRMCLAQSLYSGCIGATKHGCGSFLALDKKLCDCLASLGQLIRCLCHFIKTTLGEEHMQWLDYAGN